MNTTSAPNVSGTKEKQNKEEYSVSFSGFWNHTVYVQASSEEEAIEMAKGFDESEIVIDDRYDYVEADPTGYGGGDEVT